MSETSTIWHDLDARRSSAAMRHRFGVLLAAALLIAMCAAEVLFLRYVAGPDTVTLLSAGEAMPIGVQ